MISNDNNIPSETEILSAPEQGQVSWKKPELDANCVQGNTQEEVSEILDISTFFIPDPEIWGDTSSPATVSFSDWQEESEWTDGGNVSDPNTVFEIDEEAFEESLRESTSTQPEKEIDMSGVPTINWDFDKEEESKTVRKPETISENRLSSDASIEELIRHGIQLGMGQEVLSEISLPSEKPDSVEPEKPWISPDPFEQENTHSAFEWQNSFYVIRFREFFQWSEKDVWDEWRRRYEKILLYLLQEFDIRMENEQKNQQRMNDMRVFSRDLGLPEEQGNPWKSVPFKKIYPILSGSERKELEDRYSFYEHRLIFLLVDRYRKDIHTLQEEIAMQEKDIVSVQGRLWKLQEFIEAQDANAPIPENMRKTFSNVENLLQSKEDARMKNLYSVLKLYAQILLHILEISPIGGDYKSKNRSMQILLETLGLHDKGDELMHELDRMERNKTVPEKIHLSIDPDSLRILWEYHKTYSIQYRELKKQLKKEQEKREQMRMKQLADEICTLERELLDELWKKKIKTSIDEEEALKEREKKRIEYEQRVKEQGGEDETIIINK